VNRTTVPGASLRRRRRISQTGILFAGLPFTAAMTSPACIGRKIREAGQVRLVLHLEQFVKEEFVILDRRTIDRYGSPLEWQ